MNTKFYKQYFIYCIFYCSLIIFASCTSKNVVKTDSDNTTKVIVSTVKNDHEVEKQYINEGFISDEMYRIVILSTKEECEGNIQDISEKSRKRALVSIEKYISSLNRKVDSNSRGKILSLMDQYGKFFKKDNLCYDKNIFYYEIEKSNLRSYINNISKW